MNHASLFLTSASFGVAVAAPVGPMSLLCMRRTLTQGWRMGLATGAGIALGDACYALVAGLGLAGLSTFLLHNQRPLHFAAGLFLLYLGLRTVFSRAAAARETAPTGRWTVAFASSVFMTLTNPPTIIMFAAIFASLAPRGGFSPTVAALTVAGVFAGSLTWWCGLVAVLSAFRHALDVRVRHWIDRVAGAVLAIFGAVEVRRSF